MPNENVSLATRCLHSLACIPLSKEQEARTGLEFTLPHKQRATTPIWKLQYKQPSKALLHSLTLHSACTAPGCVRCMEACYLVAEGCSLVACCCKGQV